MIRQTLARRYAAALFDVIRKQGDPTQAEHDLNWFRDLVAGHDELTRVFENPAIPAGRKHAIVGALADRAEGLSPTIRRLMLMLAERDNLALVPAIAAAFTARLMDARRIVTAEVTTAVPMMASQRAALASALGKAGGSDVTITDKVDPSILGGVIARVGSVVYDASVARQIERMRQRLLQEM